MNKKRILPMAILIITAIFIIVLLGIYEFRNLAAANGLIRPVATVDGEPIETREFLMVAKRSRYLNLSLSELKEKALKECVRIKVQQKLGVDNGLMISAAYTDFLKRFDEENQRRREALSAGKVVYGPEQYTEDEYYSTAFSDLVFQLKEKLTFKVSKDEIEAYYNSQVKKGTYKVPDTIVVNAASLPVSDNNIKIMDKVKAEIGKKGKFLETCEKYGLNIEKKILDESTQKEDNSPMNITFTNEAASLSVAQVSEVFLSTDSYYILECLSVTDNGIYSLEEVDDRIREYLKAQKYEEYIDQLVESAEVVINKKNYGEAEIK